MFDAPIDAWYVWFGVGIVSVATLGAVLAVPTAAPPAATDVADAIDAVATAPPGATATHTIDASAYRLGPHRIGLRTEDGTAHASIAYGPITPATRGDLSQVLDGVAPDRVYDSRAAFATAARTAREGEPAWRSAPNRLTIRHVTWGNVDVTLVG